jgi:hypothetical protein
MEATNMSATKDDAYYARGHLLAMGIELVTWREFDLSGDNVPADAERFAYDDMTGEECVDLWRCLTAWVNPMAAELRGDVMHALYSYPQDWLNGDDLYAILMTREDLLSDDGRPSNALGAYRVIHTMVARATRRAA